jgi:hypothetical protein
MPKGTLLTFTLVGEYLVHGTVTDFEYLTLPGSGVKVTNLSTGEYATTTADETGEYAIDIGDTDAFPAGYSVGDEIQISVTHRSVERVWKRRVAGTEIVQDLYFTHGTWRGALRRGKFLSVEVITSKTGTTVTLRDANTRDILSITKNGEPLAATEYTFTRPGTLTFTTALLASDVLEVERTTLRSKADAKTEIIAEGDGQVRNAMARYYPSPLPTRVPELQDISEALAAARMRDLLYSGGDKPDMEAVSLRKYARDRLKELYDGTRNLTDQDGAYLAPTAKSTTTPQAQTTYTRQQNPFTKTNTRVDL